MAAWPWANKRPRGRTEDLDCSAQNVERGAYHGGEQRASRSVDGRLCGTALDGCCLANSKHDLVGRHCAEENDLLAISTQIYMLLT